MIKKIARWIRIEGYFMILERAAILCLLYSLLVILACVINPLSRIPTWPIPYIVVYCICLLIYVFIQASRFKKHAKRRQYGHKEKVDQEVFHEIAGTQTLSISENYLIWHKGMNHKIFHRDEISKAYVYGKYRPELKKSILVLDLKHSDQPEMLNYAIGEENAVNTINQWIYEAEKEKYVCSHCGGPNEVGTQYCVWCGEKIDIHS